MRPEVPPGTSCELGLLWLLEQFVYSLALLTSVHRFCEQKQRCECESVLNRLKQYDNSKRMLCAGARRRLMGSYWNQRFTLSWHRNNSAMSLPGRSTAMENEALVTSQSISHCLCMHEGSKFNGNRNEDVKCIPGFLPRQ